MIDSPTMVPPELQELYLDQAGSLNEITDIDRALGFCVRQLFTVALMFSNTCLQEPQPKEWLRRNPKHEKNQVIAITFPYKYRRVRPSAPFICYSSV